MIRQRVESRQLHRVAQCAIKSFDVEDLSGLRTGLDTFEIGIFRRLVFGLTLTLEAALFFFLLFLFSRAFPDSFFQVSSLPRMAGRRVDCRTSRCEVHVIPIAARMKCPEVFRTS